MWDYTDKVKDHFFHPRNVGTIEDPDGVGEVGSLACGDMLRLMFKLDEAGRIRDIKFQTFGCGSAIAASSALTELVKGKTLDEAQKITNQDIARYLGGLPEQKMHCSVMGREALGAAIDNYRSGGVAKRTLEGRVICTCFGVTEKQIETAVRENGLRTVEDVTNYTKAGGGCGGCHPEIEKILARTWETDAASASPRKKLTTIQKIRTIEETIDREIRPHLESDGGGIDLVDVEGDRVVVALRGLCSGCAAAGVTIKDFIQAKLREFVSEDLVVEEEDS